MINRKEKASIISVIVNLFLTGSKLAVGFIGGSAAITADGIHSGLDVLSSVVAYFGIRTAVKPKDEKHPYGYQISETLAGLAVVVLLALSAVWIAYEGIGQIIARQEVSINIWGFAVIIASIILNELIARYKLKVGREEDSLALVADGQHSRADVISSVGVLFGLFIVNYISVADGVIALLIGLYILYESWGLGRETIDQLIGVNDEEAETEIKTILKKKNITLSDIKTRRIGSASFAEITVKLDAKLKVEEAGAITKELQASLLEKIERLDYIVIQVESHEYKEGAIRQHYGRQIRWQGKYYAGEKHGIKDKQGRRTIIPIKDGDIHSEFGAPRYLVIDRQDGKIVFKQTVDNPDYEEGAGRGMRIVKALRADEIIARHIGADARARTEQLGIKVILIDKDKRLKDIEMGKL